MHRIYGRGGWGGLVRGALSLGVLVGTLCQWLGGGALRWLRFRVGGRRGSSGVVLAAPSCRGSNGGWCRRPSVIVWVRGGRRGGRRVA